MKKTRAFRITNFDRNGSIIPDLSKIVIRYDENPDVWRSAAKITNRITEVNYSEKVGKV